MLTTDIDTHTSGDYYNHIVNGRIRETIETYTPKMSRKLWGEVADFTRSAVTDFTPNHPREAQLLLGAVARLVAWSVDTACHDLDRTQIFHGGNIEAYIRHGNPTGTKYSTNTTRLQLMRVARELGTIDPNRIASRRVRRPSILEPYSRREIASFRAAAESRSTELRRHTWTALLTFAAGCGLSTQEVLELRYSDITTTPEGVRVDIAGPNPHWTVCAHDWEDKLDRVLTVPTEAGWVVAPTIDRTGPAARHQLTSLIRAAAKHGSVPSAGRLRATWIVDRLNAGTNVVALMHSLGLTSLRPLEQYLPFATEPSFDEVAAQFRGEVTE